MKHTERSYIESDIAFLKGHIEAMKGFLERHVNEGLSKFNLIASTNYIASKEADLARLEAQLKALPIT